MPTIILPPTPLLLQPQNCSKYHSGASFVTQISWAPPGSSDATVVTRVAVADDGMSLQLSSTYPQLLEGTSSNDMVRRLRD